MKIKCKCGHIQTTGSKLKQVSCSSCGCKIPVVEYKQEVKKENE